MADVFLNGSWRIVDPTFMLIPQNSRKEIATREEICNEVVDFGVLPPERIGLLDYRQLHCQEPTVFLGNFAYRRPAVFEAVRQGKPFPGKSMATSWQRFMALPKIIASDLFIDLYVQAIRDLYKTEGDYIYGVARTYHVLGKFREARQWYAQVVTDFPKSQHVEESLFFTGLSLYHEGQHHKARNTFDKLLSKFPQSPWAIFARLFAGKSLLSLGQLKEAKSYLETLKLDPKDLRVPAVNAVRLLQAMSDNTIEASVNSSQKLR
ncbi:MAG: tetratricopeptide repeat protein [bacterium]|nr:tetratricopeptide repeat protein [bacterium]